MEKSQLMRRCYSLHLNYLGGIFLGQEAPDVIQGILHVCWPVLHGSSWAALFSIDDTNSNHVTSSADAADCSNESEDVGWSNEHMRTHSTFGYIWYELVFWKMIQTSSTDNRNLFRPLLPQGSARSNGQPRLAMTFGDTPFHRHLLALSAEYERVVGENAELRREHFGGFCYGVGDGVGDCHMLLNMSWHELTGSDRVRAFWACVLRKDWGRCSKFEGEERDWIGGSPAREGGGREHRTIYWEISWEEATGKRNVGLLNLIDGVSLVSLLLGVAGFYGEHMWTYSYLSFVFFGSCGVDCELFIIAKCTGLCPGIVSLHWGCRLMEARGACSNCERWRSVSTAVKLCQKGCAKWGFLMWLFENCLCISPCICQDFVSVCENVAWLDFQLRQSTNSSTGGYLTSIPSWEIIIHVGQPGFAAFAACNFSVWGTDHRHGCDNLWPSWSCKWQLHGENLGAPVVWIQSFRKKWCNPKKHDGNHGSECSHAKNWGHTTNTTGTQVQPLDLQLYAWTLRYAFGNQRTASLSHTPPTFNIEDRPSQKEHSLPTIFFQGPRSTSRE